MKTSVSLDMDKLWAFIRSLSLSVANKRWLAEKLLEDANREKAAGKEEWNAGIAGAWKEDGLTAEEEVALLRNARVQGVTRRLIDL